jgi:hypothetical protein
MTTETTKLLNRLSAHLGDASDYRIAKELGVTKQTVSAWRVGKGTMSDATAVHVAELLGENPAYVLAVVHEERTDSPEAQKVWKKIAATFGGKAAVIILTAGLASFGKVDSAAASMGYDAVSDTFANVPSIHYAHMLAGFSLTTLLGLILLTPLVGSANVDALSAKSGRIGLTVGSAKTRAPSQSLWSLSFEVD